MPTPSPSDTAVQSLIEALPDLLPMRRGSLIERYITCGKPACPCASDEDARHGPYFALSRVIRSKTVSRYITREQADVVRRQVAAGGEFRKIIEQFWEAAERLADQEIEAPTDASKETAEKGGSATNSRRRSKPKSPR